MGVHELRDFEIGDALPGGTRATTGFYPNEARPLLELPIELILPAHGDPIRDNARSQLRHALDVREQAPPE